MNMEEAFQHLNWLAVFVAALSTFMIGGIWYAVLKTPWMAANHFSNEDLDKRNMPLIFGLSFFFALLMSVTLALFIGKEDASYGGLAGFLAGTCWVALGIAVIALFENRPLKYVLINGGYMILSFTTMGIILGAWK